MLLCQILHQPLRLMAVEALADQHLLLIPISVCQHQLVHTEVIRAAAGLATHFLHPAIDSADLRAPRISPAKDSLPVEGMLPDLHLAEWCRRFEVSIQSGICILLVFFDLHTRPSPIHRLFSRKQVCILSHLRI